MTSNTVMDQQQASLRPSAEFMDAVSSELEVRPVDDAQLIADLQGAVAGTEPAKKRKGASAKAEPAAKKTESSSSTVPHRVRERPDEDAAGEGEGADASIPAESDVDSDATKDSDALCVPEDVLMEIAQNKFQHFCGRCERPVQPLSAVMKVKAPLRLWCQECNKATTMLHRKLAWPPVSFSSLPEDEQVQFWVKAADKGRMSNGQFDYGQLRGVLKESLTVRKTREFSASIDTEDLPLSVWVSRGWDAEHIKATCACKQDPVHGDVYCVPVRSTKQSAIVQQIEEEIAAAEKAIKKKKALGETATAEEKEEHKKINIETESSSTSSSSKKKKKKNKKKDNSKAPPADENAKQRERRLAKEERQRNAQVKQDEKRLEKEEAAKKKKELDGVVKHNSKMQGLASILLPSVSPIHADAKEALKDAASILDRIPPHHKNEMADAIDDMNDLMEQATALTKALPKCIKNSTKVPEMTRGGDEFDKKKLTTWCGEWKTTIKKFKDMKALC